MSVALLESRAKRGSLLCCFVISFAFSSVVKIPGEDIHIYLREEHPAVLTCLDSLEMKSKSPCNVGNVHEHLLHYSIQVRVY